MPNQNIRTQVVEWIEEKHKQRRAILAGATAAVGGAGAKGGAGEGVAFAKEAVRGASKKKNIGRNKGRN